GAESDPTKKPEGKPSKIAPEDTGGAMQKLLEDAKKHGRQVKEEENDPPAKPGDRDQQTGSGGDTPQGQDPKKQPNEQRDPADPKGGSPEGGVKDAKDPAAP